MHIFVKYSFTVNYLSQAVTINGLMYKGSSYNSINPHGEKFFYEDVINSKGWPTAL